MYSDLHSGLHSDLHSDQLPYPVDLFPLQNLTNFSLDSESVPYRTTLQDEQALYDPTYIAEYALAHWNAYLTKEDTVHKAVFMVQASWLFAHQTSFDTGAGGWFIPSTQVRSASGLYVSASTQGVGVSVLVRAYQVTHEERFLQAACRAVRTFALDILDGGVHAPIGTTGLFFEEVAAYPASHALKGHILALFGLYDYVMLTKESMPEELIRRGIAALHMVLSVFDTGYWTRIDLLHKSLASRTQHALHVELLTRFALYVHCKECTPVAARWRHYQQHPVSLLQSMFMRSIHRNWENHLKPHFQQLLHVAAEVGTSCVNDVYKQHAEDCDTPPRYQVCVPITSFPVPGGMRSVLKSVAQVMNDRWHMLYLTHYKGTDTENLEIELFGNRIASPWQFPGIWLYCISGGLKLLHALRRSSGYDLILPQDGVYTAAFAALIGKMVGIRVVCMDHGNVTLLKNSSYLHERLDALTSYTWVHRMVLSLLLRFYGPSQYLLARIATPCIDHFLVAGDEVEEVYRTLLHVHPSRISRYAYVIDTARFTPLTKEAWTRARMEQGLAEDAIIITLINRLAIEKGLSFAVEGIALALSILPGEVRERVRVLIAGEGPLRPQVEADIQNFHIGSQCFLWGEAKPEDVIMLLGISDIFLYSGTRGTNFSVAVLEAMAAGCAVVASVMPRSNAQLLADGRGIAVAPSSASEIGDAIARLCADATLRRSMGQLARDYVATHHDPLSLQRSLLRASFFTPLYQL